VRRSRFFARRALRILPLYYGWVVLGAAVSANSLADFVQAGPYLLFLEPFAGRAPSLKPYSDVWWSLAIEAQFYLLLPLLGLALRSSTGRRVGAVVLALYVVAYTAFASHWLAFQSGLNNELVSFSIFGRGSAFLAGIGAAYVHGRFGARIREACSSQTWLRNGGADAVLLLVLLALGEHLRRVVLVGFFPAENIMPAWHVSEALLWTTCVLAVLLLPLRMKRLLSNKPMQLVGLLSYSLYLCHLPLLFRTVLHLQLRHPGRFDGWTPEAFAVTAAALALCLGVSALTYRYVERPFLTRKARVSD
jgi:peptidoglycan/LPS O-acetylase OafA/YrhL